MNRRDCLRLGGAALMWPLGLLLDPVTPFLPRQRGGGPYGHIFFSRDDVPRIRSNARTPLLRPVVEAWAAASPDVVREAMEKVAATGNLVYDFRDALGALLNASLVQLVDPTPDRREAVRYGVEATLRMPRWDYMLEGGTEVIGLMRASMATAALLFARDVLADEPDAALEAALLEAVAEKGALPCYRTIVGMNRPEAVQGWSFDEVHRAILEIDLSRWPEILGANNLRTVPTMGLGLGALAVEGRDPRAAGWLDTAVASAEHFLGFLSPDGSYFEGLSYVDYALRTLFTFMEPHQRLKGTVDWGEKADWEGVTAFLLAAQAGRHADGAPDIVNFSDARRGVYPCVPAWIARQTGSGVAQWAVEEVAEPGYFLDFLWYEPERPVVPPPDALKDVRLDIGWVISRTGWQPDDAVLAFRSGGPANHEHADRNSFLFKVYGERLLTDHPGAAYDPRHPGWLLRLTEAHNAVLVGGEGHQYHRGEEGTNAGLAEAHVVRHEADGDRVWWCSDATHGYHLVNPDVVAVTRTVAFAKPDVVVVLDRVQLRENAARVDVRFFPDNQDGHAVLDVDGAQFVLRRPGARLHGLAAARTAAAVAAHRLDLPPDMGAFPFVEVTSPPARMHEVVTLLVARPSSEDDLPALSVQQTTTGWRFDADGVRGVLATEGPVPEVHWG